MTKRKQTDFPLEEFAARLNQLIVDQSLGSQRRFSVDAGLAQQTIHSIIKGKTAPSAKILYKICSHYGVSSDWLLFGEGKRYKNPQAAVHKFCPNFMAEFQEMSKAGFLIITAEDEMEPAITAGSVVVLSGSRKIDGDGIYGLEVTVPKKRIVLHRIVSIADKKGKYEISSDNKPKSLMKMNATELKPVILGKVVWHHPTPFPVSFGA